MDDPKTRQERKGKKDKQQKEIYNQKTVRIKEALLEKQKTNKKDDKK
jgi:hypothetical protein